MEAPGNDSATRRAQPIELGRWLHVAGRRLAAGKENAPDAATGAVRFPLEHETGFEPATLTLARAGEPEEDQ
jgi:hypothetical protein